MVLTVVTPYLPSSIEYKDDGSPRLTKVDEQKDAVDAFNHPRLRRALVLNELQMRTPDLEMEFRLPTVLEEWQSLYKPIHSRGLLEFLSSAWDQWAALGEVDGQDDSGSLDSPLGRLLIFGNSCLPREKVQRPSKHVIGQIGYYCTDIETFVFEDLTQELLLDASLVTTAVATAQENKQNAVFVIPTHPGHHAAADSFGGYCYVNHVAAAAKLFGLPKVAILDVDYHAGNGTASIFYSDPSVLVVSLHCDPDFDYPFHSGFADETGEGDGQGCTLHLPLPPGTTWEGYEQALTSGLQAIRDYGAQALLISMGLDTYKDDPCAIRRAGFCLEGDDYVAMGALVAKMAPPNIPVMFLQEGGYRMDKIGTAASDVVTSFSKTRISL